MKLITKTILIYLFNFNYEIHVCIYINLLSIIYFIYAKYYLITKYNKLLYKKYISLKMLNFIFISTLYLLYKNNIFPLLVINITKFFL